MQNITLLLYKNNIATESNIFEAIIVTLNLLKNIINKNNFSLFLLIASLTPPYLNGKKFKYKKND